MGAWGMLLLIVAVTMVVGTCGAVAWTAWRPRRFRGVPRLPSLVLQRACGQGETLNGILLVNEGRCQAVIATIGFTVDNREIAGVPSQVGSRTVEAAGLPPDRVRVCNLVEGTAIPAGGKVWLISAQSTPINGTDTRQLEEGLARIGIEVAYRPESDQLTDCQPAMVASIQPDQVNYDPPRQARPTARPPARVGLQAAPVS